MRMIVSTGVVEGRGEWGWDQWKWDATRVIVSPNVVEGRGEGGIGAVERRINFKQG